MDPAASELHELVMDFVRIAGLLQPDLVIPGQPISLSQAYALHELDVPVPPSQGELAARLRLEKSTVSRMAADMERNGLLVRERDPDNRRLYRLRLTDRGRALHAGLGIAFHDKFDKWVAAMTQDERDALLVGLPALIRAIREVDLIGTHRPAP